MSAQVEFDGPLTEREMEWARIIVHRRLDEKKTEEVRAIFDRLDKSHEALRDLLRRVLGCINTLPDAVLASADVLDAVRNALPPDLRAECEKVVGK
jgi:hypothetical protein